MDIEEGRIDAGVEHWRQAIRQDPQQLSKLLAFGTYLWNQQQVVAAKPLLELFVATAPSGEYEEEIQRVRGALGG